VASISGTGHVMLYFKGLDHCVQLEELILSDNLLKKLEGM